MPGAGLTGATLGKALSDLPTFQPYWGNPTVRNDRGERGNIGMTGLRLAPTRPPKNCPVSPRVGLLKQETISYPSATALGHTMAALTGRACAETDTLPHL